METPASKQATAARAGSAHDPYAPPGVDPAVDEGPTAADESTRRELLQHEASLRSVGSLFYLSAAGLLAANVMLLTSAPPGVESLLVGALYAAIALLLVFVGRGMRRLSPGARVPATILAAIGLLGFPLGTLLNVYVLYLLHSAKGKRVMTPEYAEIIARTPHIKYRVSRIVVVAFALLILLLALAVLIPALKS